MRNIIHSWKNLSLIEQQVILPTGKSFLHTTVNHPGATVILPITKNNDVILLRQYRPSIQAWLYELPAGTIEDNESPLMCAKRELGEEAGYCAESWMSLGQLTPMAGFCDEIQYLFIAKDLDKTTAYQCDDDEVIEVLTCPVSVLEQKIINGEITDAKTIACLSKATLCGVFSE